MELCQTCMHAAMQDDEMVAAQVLVRLLEVGSISLGGSGEREREREREKEEAIEANVKGENRSTNQIESKKYQWGRKEFCGHFYLSMI